MIKVTLTIEAVIDPDELASVYTNEDLLLEEVKDHISFGLDRLGVEDVTFTSADTEEL